MIQQNSQQFEAGLQCLPVMSKSDKEVNRETSDKDSIPSVSTSNLSTPILNISNLVLGAGVLNLASCFKEIGYLCSIALLFISFILAWFSFYIYPFIGNRYNKHRKNRNSSNDEQPTLKQIWLHYYPSLWFLLDSVIIANCFIAMLSYLLVITDSVPTDCVKRIIGNRNERVLRYIKKAVILVPLLISQFFLAQLESFQSLKYFSLLGLASNMYLVLLNILTIFQKKSGEEFKLPMEFSIKSVGHNLAVFTVTYNGHFASISLFNDFVDSVSKQENMKQGGIRRSMLLTSFKASAFVAFLILFLINSSIGLSGYKAFGNKVETNISKNYGDSISGNFLNLFISISVYCSFPFAFRVYLTSLQGLLRILIGKKKMSEICTLLLLVVLGLLVNDLKMVNTIRGLFTGTVIVFIVPGMMLQKESINKKRMRWWFMCACCLIVYGVSVSVLGCITLLL